MVYENCLNPFQLDHIRDMCRHERKSWAETDQIVAMVVELVKQGVMINLNAKRLSDLVVRNCASFNNIW